MLPDYRGSRVILSSNASDAPRPRASRKSRQPSYDAIVVGGGPAGAVMSWSLAKRGLRVLTLDRARFPREKVCGDFVEPRGLSILQTMGCLGELESTGPLAITHVNLTLNGKTAYRGRIPFYAGQKELPQHGYIIPREALDQRILASSVAAGATLQEGCQVTAVERVDGTMIVHYRDATGDQSASAPIVVGDTVVAGISGGDLGMRGFLDAYRADTGERIWRF